MYRIRAVVKTKDPMLKAHEGLEKLMLKIGIFSSLYLVSTAEYSSDLEPERQKIFNKKSLDNFLIEQWHFQFLNVAFKIPASILLGCYFYTYMYNVQWNETWLHDHCYYRNQNGPKFGFNCPCGLDEVRLVRDI